MLELKAIGIVVDAKPYLQVPPAWNKNVNLRHLVGRTVSVKFQDYKTFTVNGVEGPFEGGQFIPKFFKLFVKIH